MALVNITNILFDSDTALFTSPIQMQITFEVLRNLPQEIEWKLIYVGSPNSDQYDQVLESFSMPPLQQGVMQFTLMSQGPNYQMIPSKEDLFGASAIILIVSYNKKEFFRVGYFLYNTYLDPELLENDPTQILIDKVYRQINIQQPRITRSQIDWEGHLFQLYVPPQVNNNLIQQQQQVFNDLTNTTQGQNQQQEKQQQSQQQQQQQQSYYQNNSYQEMQNIF